MTTTTTTELREVEWKTVKSFPEYSVSRCGMVSKKNKFEELKCYDNHGYYIALLFKDGKIHRRRVHRLIAEAFLGPCPEKGYQVNHKNFNTLDNRVENLEWVSGKDNMRHYYATLHAKGESVKAQKVGIYNPVTETWNTFPSLYQCAKFFGVKPSTMCGMAIDCINYKMKYKGYEIYKLDDDYNILTTAYPRKFTNQSVV